MMRTAQRRALGYAYPECTTDDNSIGRYGAVGHQGVWKWGAIDGEVGKENTVGRVRVGSERRAG